MRSYIKQNKQDDQDDDFFIADRRTWPDNLTTRVVHSRTRQIDHVQSATSPSKNPPHSTNINHL